MFGNNKVPRLSFAPFPFTGAIAISVNPVLLKAEWPIVIVVVPAGMLMSHKPSINDSFGQFWKA